MRLFKSFLIMAAIATGVGACYVEAHDYSRYPPRYTTPYCAAGYYWDGHYCRHY